MFIYSVVLQGNNSKDTTRREFALVGGDYATALANQAAIRAELVDATDSFIKSETLREVLFEDNQLPAVGIDTYECAAVTVHLNAPTEAEKVHVLYIPAPPSDFFLTDGTTLDPSNADLQAYVAAIANNATVSDGEAINTASGSGGIKSGYKIVKAKNFRA